MKCEDDGDTVDQSYGNQYGSHQMDVKMEEVESVKLDESTAAQKDTNGTC